MGVCVGRARKTPFLKKKGLAAGTRSSEKVHGVSREISGYVSPWHLNRNAASLTDPLRFGLVQIKWRILYYLLHTAKNKELDPIV